MEGDTYLKLEQRGLETKQSYENKIADIKLSNEKAIRRLVDEFKVNLMKVQEEMKESQQVSAHLKHFYSKKLEKHEAEHEFEIVDNRERHKEKKIELEKTWKTLESNQKNSSEEKNKLLKERDEKEQAYISAQNKRKEIVKLLEEKAKQIQLLE